MMNRGEPCVLEDRLCQECGECDLCELNPAKICDNCCQCIETTADYAEIQIDDILTNETDLKEEAKERLVEEPRKSFRIKPH